MITLQDAKKECAKDNRCYIAWTYAGYDNYRDWPTKKAAENHRDTYQVPQYAPNKTAAAKYWPAFRCLYCCGEIVDYIG